MPLYKFRLEAQDGSGHYRTGTISDESKAEARRYLEEKEAGFAIFGLDTEELAAMEAAEKDAADQGVPAHPDVRAKLALHRQGQPYELVDLEKVS